MGFVQVIEFREKYKLIRVYVYAYLFKKYNMSVFTLTYFVGRYVLIYTFCKRYSHKDEEKNRQTQGAGKSVKEKEKMDDDKQLVLMLLVGGWMLTRLTEWASESWWVTESESLAESGEKHNQ